MARSYTLRDMPDQLWREIKAAAAYDGISIKDWLLQAAREKLNSNGKQGSKFMDQRIYAYCKVCGNVVYREPGKRHGDGELDTEDNPVWLIWSDIEDYEGDPDELETITCGCN